MIALLLSLLLLLLPQPIHAIYDPLSVPNNKFGIHIADFNDIPDISPLVNSSGGDWGYVTLVSADNDRDHGKWQTIFNQMRRDHLIPIVRIATHVEGNHWAKPNPNDFDSIATFFNSLSWPIQNRYIVLYNEPNHASEWGNSLDPEGYAADFVSFAQKLKSASSDFFILPAGLDESAVNGADTMDAFAFLRRMVAAQPQILTSMDGWTSHSYPNQNYSGSPYASGRGTLYTFTAELSFLQSLGLTKNVPVFITETGWMHSQGKVVNKNFLSSDAIGNDLQIAATGVWTDPRIVAITPFVFNYQDVPFDNFSWKELGTNQFYAQYDAYQAIAKIQGEPIQKETYTLRPPLLPSTLVTNSSYTLSAMIHNDGQGILDIARGYDLTLDDEKKGFMLFADPLPAIEPTENGELTIHLKTPSKPGIYHLELYLNHFGRHIVLQTRTVTVVPPPTVDVSVQLGWRRANNADNVTVLVYDNDMLLQKFDGLTLTNGHVIASNLTNIVPGRQYRVVTIVPYYLPRQEILALSKEVTHVGMKRFLPLDFNGDGKFTIADIWTLLKNPPSDILHLFVSP